MSLVLHYPMNNSRLLPPEYQEVAYLESTGTQYIITDYVYSTISSNFKADIKFSPTNLDSSEHDLFGLCNSSYFVGGIWGNNFYLYRSNYYRPGNLSNNETYITTYEILSDGNSRITSNGVAYTVQSGTNVTSNTQKLYLFNVGPANYAYISAKVYFMNFWDSEKLVLKLIPCYRKSDNKPGMYDVSEPENLTKKRFYTNSGSGEFIIGPEVVNLPEEYQQVEDIEFKAGTYIGTGLTIPSSHNLSYKIGVRYAAGSGDRDLWGYSGAGGGYTGVTNTGAYEPHSDTYFNNSTDITKYNIVIRTNETNNETGEYRIGALGTSYSTRTKYYSRIQLTLNGSIEVDWISCFKKSTGESGFFDLVTRGFVTASNHAVGNPVYSQLEYNAQGQNLWAKDSGWTVTNSSLSRKDNLGFNNIPGPWTISFDAYASQACTASIDICDQGNKTINLTTTKQHYFITATAKNYYQPGNYNGFFDIAGFSGTVYLSNIALYRGSHDFGYAAPRTSAAITNIGYKYGLEGTYDKTIYTESDGSKWIRIAHHNNPASKLFSSSDPFTTSFYTDDDRWWDFPKCNKVNSWELMVKQKATTSSSEVKYRWIQPANPMTCSFNDIHGKVINNTTSEYTSVSSNCGGYFYSNSSIYLRFDNNTDGTNWYGFGSWTTYQGGYPGYNGACPTTGYEDVYLRIDNCMPPTDRGCFYFKDNSSYLITNPLQTITNGSISFWRRGLNGSGWLLFSDSSAHYICATAPSESGHWSNGAGSPTMYIDGNTTAAARGLFDTDWHHYVITGISISSWQDLRINASNNHSSSWNPGCYLSDVRFYDHILSGAEIKELYNLKKI